MKDEHDHAKGGLPPRGTPKNYLMAWLLVMVKNVDLHGYEIMKELREEFAVVSDPGTVYRALRQLEHEGFIVSRWAGHDHGPNRRVYHITPAGDSALALWCGELERYRENIDVFLRIYAGTWTVRDAG